MKNEFVKIRCNNNIFFQLQDMEDPEKKKLKIEKQITKPNQKRGKEL